MLAASRQALKFLKLGMLCKAITMRSTAHAKFTAVGRLAFKHVAACCKLASESSSSIASAMPYAAAAPINGAPRTCMVLIAFTICARLWILTISNANGSLV